MDLRDYFIVIQPFIRRTIVGEHRRGDDLTHEHLFDSFHLILRLVRDSEQFNCSLYCYSMSNLF